MNKLIHCVRNGVTLMRQLALENRGLLWVVFIAAGVCCLVFAAVIVPSWKDPKSKFYGSKLGYPAALRKLNKPLPVEVAVVKRAPFERWVMGEGTCASIPLLAPVIPIAMVKEVLVEPGDYVKEGQVLARLDESMLNIKLESAKLSVETAKAEYARVEYGSAYVLAQERPEMEKINLAAQEALVRQTSEKVDKYRSAFERGAVSKTTLIGVEGEFTAATKLVEQARIQMMVSQRGVEQSLKIARNAVKDATEAVRHRELELANYQVRSPGTGLIERVLINVGEYNQDPGKPGFVVASGNWFEAHFDQADYADVKKGMPAKIFLEAFPGKTMSGVVEKIIPVVSFNQGGPEINRPLRPRGSGAAEWAATFRTQIKFENEAQANALGMTGFARIHIQRENLAVPRGALVAVSAGIGYVYVIDQNNTWISRLVEVGIVEEKKVEILSGLSVGDRVIVRGQWVLLPNDRVEVIKTWADFSAPDPAP